MSPEKRLQFIDLHCGDSIVAAKVIKLWETASRKTEASRNTLTGLRIQHYLVEEELGRGGMGEVYAAVDERLGRRVAIKFLAKSVFDSESALERFIGEARASSALNHPHIVTIHDFIQQDDLAAIVMELIHGTTLRNAFPAPVAETEVARIGAQTARALDAAHRSGIIHRDIKPENIMLRADGYVKLVDFGLARLAAARPAEVSTGNLSAAGGTWIYMSPEQISGKPLTAATDIYSLGLVLCELLRGSHPWANATGALLESAAEGTPPVVDISSVVASPGLKRLLARMLYMDPNQRPSAAEVVRTLDALQSRDWAWWKLAAVGALLVAVAVTVLFRAMPPRLRNLVPTILTSLAGNESGVTFSPEGSRIAYAADRGRPGQFDIYLQPLLSGAASVRLTSDPATELAPAWSPDGRWIAFLREIPGGRSAVTLIAPNGTSGRKLIEIGVRTEIDDPALEWSGDSEWLILPDSLSQEEPERYALFAVSLKTGERRRLTEPSSTPQYQPALSEDERMLAYFIHANGAEKLSLQKLQAGLRPEGGPITLTLNGFEKFYCRNPQWIRGTRELVFVSNREGSLRFWTVKIRGVQAGDDAVLLNSLGDDVSSPAVSRDGRLMAYTHVLRDANTWRLDRRSRNAGYTAARRLQGSTRQERHPQLSPDGRRIAFESDRSGFPEIWISDADGANAVPLTNFRGPVTRSPKWSPDGGRIVFDAHLEGQPEIYTISLKARAQPVRLTNHPANDIMPCFSADGNSIYFTSNRSGHYSLWQVPAGGGNAVEFSDQQIYDPISSLDGQYLYFTHGPNTNKSIGRIDIDTGRPENLVSGVLDRSLAPVLSGVYFIRFAGTDRCFLQFFSSGSKHLPMTMATLNGNIRQGLSASHDGSVVLFTKEEQSGSDLMLVRDLR